MQRHVRYISHSPDIQKWQNDIFLPENFMWNDLIPHLRKFTKDTTFGLKYE